MVLKIKEALKRNSKTAVWLAAEIGIAQPSMSNIVNNKVSPSLETLEKIAAALQVDVVELFDHPEHANLKCPHCGNDLNVKIE